MEDNSLKGIYGRIYVEIKNQDSLDSLQRLYEHIDVVINNTNSDAILNKLYSRINVVINGVGATNGIGVSPTSGPVNSSQMTQDQLRDLYENRINVVINNVNINETETETETEIETETETDRFNKMLKDIIAAIPPLRVTGKS